MSGKRYCLWLLLEARRLQTCENWVAKAHPEAEAAEYFDKTEIEILEKCSSKKVKTTTDYVLALGKLPGFVKSKAQPLPGEKLLWQSVMLLNATKAGFIEPAELWDMIT